MNQELKYNIFLYIQEYDRYVTNIIECNEESDYFLVKCQKIVQLENGELNERIPTIKEQNYKVIQFSFEKWLQKKKEQEIIDNGIIEL